MSTPKRRNPKAYNGTHITTHNLKNLLPDFMYDIGGKYLTPADEVKNYWGEMMGAALSPHALPEKFVGGVLTVKVRNSTLFALLAHQEKPKLLKRLREAFPKLTIKTIEFRIG